MSVAAIIMMLISIITVWGGLALALINLVRHPEQDDDVPAGTAPQR